MVPRGAEHQSQFDGLEDQVHPYDLLRLVRDVGHLVGLSGGDIQHLDYLISHTREIDWHPGQRPIIYKSVCVMARERGVSERQIWNRESRLHSLGCLLWNDMGNFRRTGGRDKSGRIAFAYGVDLTPIARRYDEFAALKKQQIEDMAHFNEARRQVSGQRRRCLVKITMAQERGLDVEDLVERFGGLPRVRAGHSLTVVNDLLDHLREIETTLDTTLDTAHDSGLPEQQEACDFSTHCMGLPACGLTQNTSDQSEVNFRHIQPTNNPQSSKDDTCNRGVTNDRENVGKNPEHPTTGVEHLTVRQLVQAASEELSSQILPTGRKVGLSDIVDASARHCHHLGIHKSAWADACSVMGRAGAATAVIIIDRNINHPDTPIRNPGGVLRSMTARAQTGALHLHRSIFGILDRDAQEDREGGAI